MYVCTMYVCGAVAGQRVHLVPWSTGYELPWSCWELNSDLLEEKPMLLTTEPVLIWRQILMPFWLGSDFNKCFLMFVLLKFFAHKKNCNLKALAFKNPLSQRKSLL